MLEPQIKTDISLLKNYWYVRNKKMEDWFSILTLVDQLAARGLESYASNEPQTFYNMAHYLLTKGNLSHLIPVYSDSSVSLDKRAKIDRACAYNWSLIDIERKYGGDNYFIDDLGFFMLVTGWFSVAYLYDEEIGRLRAQVWNPSEVYPRFANGRLASCVHSHKLSIEEVIAKAETNGWSYTAPHGVCVGESVLDDYFTEIDGVLHNQIFVDGKAVTDMIPRDEMKILVAPVGGFPDKGSLTRGVSTSWKKLVGRSIFEVNAGVISSFNKWKTMINQILRDTAQPVTEEFSSVATATPEQIRERGAFFHYSPGEQGLVRLPAPSLPVELQSNMLELRREMQKGSFNDAVYGMVEGQSGYALSLLASSSANQILYPYMDGKHFVISEGDKFWLKKLKTSKKSFIVKGYFDEELKTEDIPEDVEVVVNSSVATPKDWLERGQCYQQLKDILDEETIFTEILHITDTQSVKKRRSLQRIMEHPMTQQIEMIAAYKKHAEYLRSVGDSAQAETFSLAAASLERQMGSTFDEGEGAPQEASEVAAQREAGTAKGSKGILPQIAAPEATQGFTPQQLRYSIGKGTMKAEVEE
jgi:hypothetical protein